MSLLHYALGLLVGGASLTWLGMNALRSVWVAIVGTTLRLASYLVLLRFHRASLHEGLFHLVMAFVWLVPLVADFAAWLRLILHQEQFQATLNETTTQFIDSSGK